MYTLGLIVLAAVLFAVVSTAVVRAGVRAYFREKRGYLKSMLNPDDKEI